MTARIQFEEQLLEFQSDTIVIGRECEFFKICDYTVSRKHFELQRKGEAYYILDLESRSGTYVNGIKIPEQGQILPDFAQIRCGQSVFNYRYLGNIRLDKDGISLLSVSSNEINTTKITDAAGPMLAFLYQFATLLQENKWSNDAIKRELLKLISDYFLVDIVVLFLCTENEDYKVVATFRKTADISLESLVVPKEILKKCCKEHHSISYAQEAKRMLYMPIETQPLEHIIYLERHQPQNFNQNEIMSAGAASRLVAFHDKIQKLSEQLNRSMKLEMIGTTAAGIVHSFNNILNCLLGHIGLLEDQMESCVCAKQCQESIENIRASIQEGTLLTTDMMTYLKGKDYQKKPIDLANLLKSLHKIYRPVLPKNITFDLTLHKTPIQIQGNQSQLYQAISNLLSNAIDAMPDGGRLCIETSAAQEESFVQILVQDTGTGMNEVTLKKIFTPFFTTKSKDKGTGLGLCYTLAVVEQHGGKICAESHVNQGTKFFILLPARQSALQDTAT